MQFKDGVYTKVTRVIKGVEEIITPSVQIRAAWSIADEVSRRLTGKEIIITSILDGKHKTGSKHYSGNAFDIRIYIYTKPQLNELIKALKIELGSDYDVVLENDHIHIEYDPK